METKKISELTTGTAASGDFVEYETSGGLSRKLNWSIITTILSYFTGTSANSALTLAETFITSGDIPSLCRDFPSGMTSFYANGSITGVPVNGYEYNGETRGLMGWNKVTTLNHQGSNLCWVGEHTGGVWSGWIKIRNADGSSYPIT